jgi:hypothetical protein
VETVIFLLHGADAVGYIHSLVDHKDIGFGTGKLQGGEHARWPGTNDDHIGHTNNMTLLLFTLIGV